MMAQFAQHSNRVMALGVALWLGACAVARGNELVRYEESRVAMACTYTIVVYGRDAASLPRIVNAGFDEIDRIDRLMSHYQADSPLSRINREAAKGPLAVEPELYDFLKECVRYSRDSDGAFDVTVGPLMKAWGFFHGEGRLPSGAELAAARAKIGYRHLIFDDAARTVQFDQAGVELDLGGIAKGYAVDCAVALLKREGITSALVSAGGSTIYGLGAPPGSVGWDVQLQDPLRPAKTALTLCLKDRALSMSGSAEKFFEIRGVRYSHIMDPRTARPVQGVLSVAVLTATGTAGDALDNVFYVAGVRRSRAYLKKLPNTEVFFFLPEGKTKWRLRRLKP